MLVYTCFTSIWYTTWPLTYKEKNTLWPLTRGRGCVQGQHICFHSALCSMPFNLICNMPIKKNIWFDLLIPHQGQGCVCGQNICYRVAAFVVSFKLICNMIIFRKTLTLASAPHPKSTQGVGPRPSTIILFDMLYIYVTPLPAYIILAKNIDNCLSYCEI